MNNGSINSNFGLSKNKSGVSITTDQFELILDNDCISDIKQLGVLDPAQEAIRNEEAPEAEANDDYRAAKRESISGLISFLFKNIGDKVVSPYELALRAYVLCFIMCPHLIGNISLQKLGEIFNCSRQLLSARVLKMSKTLNIKATSGKADTARAKLSDAQKDRWANKREEERIEHRRQYLKEYRAKNREALLARHRDYYQRNKTRILTKRKKDRDK